MDPRDFEPAGNGSPLDGPARHDSSGSRDTQLLHEGQLLDQYRITRMLGRGGMGQVFLAEHLTLEKKVAVKVLPPELARQSGFVERFQREAQTLDRLDHPHIVRVYDARKADGHFMIIMDFVGGGDLEGALVAAEEGLPLEKVHALLAEILEGLAYAHGKGVVHRDLKPANILVSNKGEMKISDFGLAQVVGNEFMSDLIEKSIAYSQLANAETIQVGSGSSDAALERLAGTIDYMSPEARMGETVGPSSDVYALGIIAYRCLTGRRVAAFARPPSHYVKGLGRRWDRWVEKCLAPEPEERFPDAAAALAALPPPGSPNKRLAYVALAATVVALAAGGFIAYPYVFGKTPAPAETQASASEPAAPQRGTLVAQKPATLPSAPPVSSSQANEPEPPPRSEPVAVQPEPAKPAVVPPSYKPSVSTPPPPPPPALLSVVVRVNPTDADVRIRGAQVSSLGAGTYMFDAAAGSEFDLSVSRSGYQSIRRELEISENRRTFDFNLRQVTGEVSFYTTPRTTIELIDARGTVVQRGVSNSNGEIRFRDVPSQTYSARLERDGFETVVVPRLEVSEADRSVSVRQLLTPEMGRTAPAVSEVVDPDRAPVPPARDLPIPSAAERMAPGPSAPQLSVQEIESLAWKVAERRGWTPTKISHGLIKLRLERRGYDATLYLRCDPTGVEIFSDSYAESRLPFVGGRKVKHPDGWIENIREDLADSIRRYRR